MATATLTSKWQITVPKQVREKLGLKPGDRLAFREREDGSIVVEAEASSVLDLFGILKPKRKRVTLQQMEDAIVRGASRR